MGKGVALRAKQVEFQFPSNGKVYLNKFEAVPTNFPTDRVSIPFKREGVSEPVMILTTILWIIVSIPFKREGVSELTGKDLGWRSWEFRFPSNGKVYLNSQGSPFGDRRG